MKVLKECLLKDYSTLHIGGVCETMLIPESEEEIRLALKEARAAGEPVFILGNGSNILFSDQGTDETIIRIGEDFSRIKRLDGNRIEVESGATNKEVAAFAQKEGLGGYEFLCGVPGTVGGAVFMNAGCYGGEVKDILKSVIWLDENGDEHETKAEDLDLSYRHSWFTDHFGVIVRAIFQLSEKDPAAIQAEMDELQFKRYDKQPMNDYSCGSTFKRPVGGYASALIDQSGLRGFAVGDAAVSEKHTGFLINKGEASAAEFLELIEQVRNRVKEDSGIELECEVRKVGRF